MTVRVVAQAKQRVVSPRVAGLGQVDPELVSPAGLEPAVRLSATRLSKRIDIKTQSARNSVQ